MAAVDQSPLISLDDEIYVEYYRFHLQDMALMRGPALFEIPQSSDWLVLGGPGGAIFSSAETDHNASVRLEYWAMQPPASGEEWVESTEVAIILDGTEVRLWSVTAEMGEHALVVPCAGEYMLRAYVWRQDTTDEFGDDDTDDDADDDTSFPAGRERWLLQLWPADPNA